jgi:hypothetical protein
LAAAHGELLAVCLSKRPHNPALLVDALAPDHLEHCLPKTATHCPSFICNSVRRLFAGVRRPTRRQPHWPPSEDRIHPARASETFFTEHAEYLHQQYHRTHHSPPCQSAASPAARPDTHLVSISPAAALWREQGLRGERVGWICRAAYGRDCSPCPHRSIYEQQQQTAQGTSNLAVGEWCAQS